MMSWNHANSECTGDENCCHPCPEARVKLVTEVFQVSERVAVCFCLVAEGGKLRCNCSDDKTRTEHWTLNTSVE